MDMQSVRGLLNSHWNLLLPVDPEKIAYSLGYDVRPLDDRDPNNDGLSGMATIENGMKVIYVNPHDHHNRQRFTIAHEIAHHYLNHTYGGYAQFRDRPSDYSTNYSSRYEREANEFAAELLMPSDAIFSLVERNGITDISKLANIFDVSESAMYWRLKNIGLVY